MQYNQAINYLESLTDYEKSSAVAYTAANYDLRRVEILLSALANPHRGRRTIHIAGTKGKGSTSAMIASTLSCAGYCSGLFTSPHLYAWQERIAVNGRPASQRDFARLVTTIKPHVQAVNTEARFGRLTTFEALAAMAFLYFKEKAAVFQVLETGLGGRLDATNIVGPGICIITSISLDHTQVLGNTLAEIAGEKAGIIKQDCTVISAPQPPQAAAVIKERCRLLNARLIRVGRDITWSRTGGDFQGQSFSVKGMLQQYGLTIPLLGDYQMENACLALAAIEALQQQGVSITSTAIANGLSGVKWPARLQILNRCPLLIIDGAHNVYSINRLIESIRKYFSYRKVYVIFGASRDKDIEGMAKELYGFADNIILTSSIHPRAASADYLEQIFAASGIKVAKQQTACASLAVALAATGKDDLILATGSLFLAADIQKAYKKSTK